MSHKLVAVSATSFEQFGCVQCGCDYVYNSRGISAVGTELVKCKECDTEFIVLAYGFKKSTLGFGNLVEYPELQKHPRTGTLKHRYVKSVMVPDAYDLVGFVKSKEVREQFLKMFSEIIFEGNNKEGTYCFTSGKMTIWLDYRRNQTNWIQLKIGSYSGCMQNVDSLSKLTSHVITQKNKSLK